MQTYEVAALSVMPECWFLQLLISKSDVLLYGLTSLFCILDLEKELVKIPRF